MTLTRLIALNWLNYQPRLNGGRVWRPNQPEMIELSVALIELVTRVTGSLNFEPWKQVLIGWIVGWKIGSFRLFRRGLEAFRYVLLTQRPRPKGPSVIG